MCGPVHLVTQRKGLTRNTVDLVENCRSFVFEIGGGITFSFILAAIAATSPMQHSSSLSLVISAIPLSFFTPPESDHLCDIADERSR